MASWLECESHYEWLHKKQQNRIKQLKWLVRKKRNGKKEMKILVTVKKNLSNEEETYYACCNIPRFSPSDAFCSVFGFGGPSPTIVGSGSSKQEAIENMKKRIRELDCEIFELDI